MSYHNILQVQTDEFNREYKVANKMHPDWSKNSKMDFAFGRMIQERGFEFNEIKGFFDVYVKDFDITRFQYRLELFALRQDITEGIFRFFVKDDNLIQFFKNTEVRKKEVCSLLESDFFDFLNDKKDSIMIIGLIGKSFACTIICRTFTGKEGNYKHFVTVLTDEMNYSFVLEDFDLKKQQKNKPPQRWLQLYRSV